MALISGFSFGSLSRMVTFTCTVALVRSAVGMTWRSTALYGLAGERLDRDLGRLLVAEPGHVGLGHVGLDLQRVEVGERHDRARRGREVHARRDGRDALAHLGHLPHHDARERRADDACSGAAPAANARSACACAQRGLRHLDAALRGLQLVLARARGRASASPHCASGGAALARSASRALHLGARRAAPAPRSRRLQARDHLALAHAAALLDLQRRPGGPGSWRRRPPCAARPRSRRR